ncbi:MAG TPA: hypothetical protein VMW52_01865, partial [Phycisphaerae bacterium]|nr:hypothetical protein [Phycisphaerae bacterium]
MVSFSSFAPRDLTRALSADRCCLPARGGPMGAAACAPFLLCVLWPLRSRRYRPKFLYQNRQSVALAARLWLTLNLRTS